MLSASSKKDKKVKKYLVPLLITKNAFRNCMFELKSVQFCDTENIPIFISLRLVLLKKKNFKLFMLKAL